MGIHPFWICLQNPSYIPLDVYCQIFWQSSHSTEHNAYHFFERPLLPRFLLVTRLERVSHPVILSHNESFQNPLCDFPDSTQAYLGESNVQNLSETVQDNVTINVENFAGSSRMKSRLFCNFFA